MYALIVEKSVTGRTGAGTHQRMGMGVGFPDEAAKGEEEAGVLCDAS
jgi:hypothetical protein